MDMQERNFSNLSEPPRSVPLSLKLFSLFSQAVGGLFILNFMLPFIYFGFGKKDGGGGVFWSTITLLFVALGAWSLIYGIYAGLRRISQYSRGRIAQAALLEKNEHWERSGKSSTLVKVFVFEYKACGQNYKLTKEFKNESTKLVEDEPFEQVLYTEEQPEKGELLDAVHARIIVDEQGVFRLSFPLQGYIYLLVDSVMLAVFVLGLLFIFGKIEFTGFGIPFFKFL